MHFFTTFDGLKLAYQDSGKRTDGGPAVLCLPGLHLTMAHFDKMGAHLPDLRLISMDYRGRGASEHDPDLNHYSIPVEAKDALALLDHLNIDKVAIIGTSRGGIIAMMLAMMAKPRLTGVLLNDIGPEVGRGAMDRIVKDLGLKPKYKTLEEAAADLPNYLPGLKNLSPERLAYEAGLLWQQTDDGLKFPYDPKLRDAVLANENNLSVDIWPFFDALQDLPLALLRGENSDLLSAETMAKMQARRPDMLSAIVKDRGHIPLLDEPESLALIRKFVEALS